MTVRRGVGQGFGFGIGCLLLGLAIVVGLIAIGSAGVKNNNVPAPNPAPAFTSAPANPSVAPAAQTLLDLKGSGIKRTARFTAGGDWTIDYMYDCSGFAGGTGNFIVTVYGADGSLADLAVNELGAKGSGSQPEYMSGTFYLEMNSECPWHVIVQG